MATMAQNQYLTAEVTTATPQKLHLMLIEGAIRYAERARQLRRGGKEEEASQTLVYAQRIVMEMITGIKQETDRDLAQKVSALYWFIYRGLVDANVRRDEARLDDALRVLREEQETWRQLCQQLGSSPEAQQAGSVQFSEHASESAQETPPAPSAWPRAAMSGFGFSEARTGGLSFEA